MKSLSSSYHSEIISPTPEIISHSNFGPLPDPLALRSFHPEDLFPWPNHRENHPLAHAMAHHPLDDVAGEDVAIAYGG